MFFTRSHQYQEKDVFRTFQHLTDFSSKSTKITLCPLFSKILYYYNKNFSLGLIRKKVGKWAKSPETLENTRFFGFSKVGKKWAKSGQMAIFGQKFSKIPSLKHPIFTLCPVLPGLCPLFI